MNRNVFQYMMIILCYIPYFNVSGQITNPRAWAEWEETDGIIIHQPNYYLEEDPAPIDIQIAEEWDSLYVDLIKGLFEEGVNIYYILDTNDRPEYHSGILDTIHLKYGINIQNPKFHIVYGCKENYNRLTKWTRDHGPMNVYKNQIDSLYFYLFKDDNMGAGAVIREYLGLNDTVFYENASGGLSSDGGNYMVDGNAMGIIDCGNNAMLTEYKTKFGLDTVHCISHYLNHCDYYMKLVNEETIIVADRLPENYTYGTEPFTYLEDSVIIVNIISYLQEQVISQYGRSLKIFKIPTPPSQKNDSLRLWYYTQHASYTNSLIVNSSVFVPQFDVYWNDSIAIDIYKKAMPGYTIVPVYSRRGAGEGGAVHCLTNSVASLDPIWISHAWFNDTVKPQFDYEIESSVMTKNGVSDVSIYYSTTTDGPFQQTPMELVSENVFRGNIPREDNTSKIYYYINAVSSSGKSVSKPFVAPQWTYEINIKEGSSGWISKTEKAFGHLEIYPNPATNYVKIDISKGSLKNGKILTLYLYDLFGRIIKKELYINNNNTIELQLASLASGKYFILIRDEDGSFLSNKFIVR